MKVRHLLRGERNTFTSLLCMTGLNGLVKRPVTPAMKPPPMWAVSRFITVQYTEMADNVIKDNE